MLEESIKYGKAFVGYLFHRFSQNRCSSIAAELTVTSLLALVPLTAVIFALLALFPSFQALADQLQSFTFQYFVPGTGETIRAYINEFVSKAKNLSGLGTLMLVVTALLMVRTIDTSFNKIWQVKSQQSLVRTLLVYWAVLTLGPILIGSSLLITSYLKSLPFISDVVSEHSQWFTWWMPFLMATSAFALMFLLIPNRKIPVLHALLAGVVTAVLFELAKFGFGIFMSEFSTYQFIFGALAALPLFLIWLYLSWNIVLFGAEFCHALDAFEPRGRQVQHPVIEMISLLILLGEYQTEGKLLSQSEVDSLAGDSRRSVSFDWLEKLVAAGIVAKGQDQSYCLVKSLQDIDYFEIVSLLDRRLPSKQSIDASSLPAAVKQSMVELLMAEDKLFSDRRVSASHRVKSV